MKGVGEEREGGVVEGEDLKEEEGRGGERKEGEEEGERRGGERRGLKGGCGMQ